MITLIVTIVPSVLIFCYFYFSDKFKEPKRIMVEVFLLGVVTTIPAGYLNNYILKTFKNGDVLNDALLTGFFAGGLVEEILKFSVLYFFVMKKNEFNEPMDGIVYGVLASLGFATLENIEYVYFHADKYEISSLNMALTRAFSAVPLHGLAGVVMGFYFGLYSFLGDKKYLGYALVMPLLFHGSYNFLLSFNGVYAFGVLAILLVYAIKLHKHLKLQQSEKLTENEIKRI
jgi:RsiW-degrading membrane proteinase PrsW (M82 family)